MDTLPFSPGMTVSEVIMAQPGIARALLDLRTLCVGCYLMHFCTLEDVAVAYELPLQQLLEKLRQATLLGPAETRRINEIAS
jgi:hypothetical protein